MYFQALLFYGITFMFFRSCTISCMKGHQFPDGSAIANMVCKDGNWLPSKEQWASIPDCEGKAFVF